MNTKFNVKSLLAGIILGAAVALSIGAATRTGSTTWEYRVVSGDARPGVLDDSINQSVTQGWEFVSASGSGADHFGFAILRREKK